MTIVRSALFNVLFVVWSFLVAIAYAPLLAGRREWAQAAARLWCWGMLQLSTRLLGLRYRVRGRENLPDGPLIVAAKHQSAWDTFFFHSVLGDPVYVLKRELVLIPFVGWLMLKTGLIPVDRSKGAQALKSMVRGTRQALARGCQVVVFPEGTRTAPGTDNVYHPGIAAVYQQLGAMVVPVALNSGVYWRRNSFVKRPGLITVEILPPMPAGLDRRAFLAQLKQQIDGATARLVAEARDAAPAG